MFTSLTFAPMLHHPGLLLAVGSRAQFRLLLKLPTGCRA